MPNKPLSAISGYWLYPRRNSCRADRRAGRELAPQAQTLGFNEAASVGVNYVAAGCGIEALNASALA
jgi:hypothetical protein